MSEWTKVTLRDVSLKTGQWKPKMEPRGKFLYIDVSAVSNDTFSITSPQAVIGHSAPGRARKIVRSRDVIYATIRPTLKRVALVPPQYDDHIASTAFCVVRANKEKAVPEFLYFLLLSDEMSKSIADAQHGASYPAVTDKDIFKQEILLPPLPEQKMIAAVLLKIQRAIEVQDKIIQSLCDLKKSTMQHIFTYGLRGEKTKMTEIGEIPKSWDVVQLGEYAEKITKGSSPRWQGFAYTNEGVLFIRSQNVGWGQLLLADTVYVDRSFNAKETRSILKRNDLLFNLVGASIGRVAMADETLDGANTNQAVGLVRFLENTFHPRFAMYFFLTKTGQSEIAYNKKDIARANISLTDIKNFRLPKPLLHDQSSVVNSLDALSGDEFHHESKKAALQDLFKTTLNKIIAGDIRVADLNIDVKDVEV